MLSSDSGSDDEQFVFVPHDSIKDVLTIIHKGKPPREPQPFAIGTNKKARWPQNLWDSGTLIYSIENPNINLKPPTNRSDRVLRFNSRFESGNLSLAYLLSPDTYHLILEYDKNKSGSCQWFYFQMKNVRKDIKYSFYISGFHKGTSVDHGGLKIFWYSDMRAKKENISWSRGGYNYEYGVTSRDNSKKRASLQFKISFPYDNDTVYLCYALPYTYSDLQRNILNWKKNHLSIFSSTTLCQTLGGRDCPLLTITSPKNISENNKNYLFFTARVHPGESNGSFVLHGLIDFLLSDHPAAKYLVDNYVIKIVPMLNIDGVVEGFYRIGLSGVDLNRVWTSPNPTNHPVITATKNLIKDLTTTGNVAVYIDFHGHSRLNGSFAYGCPNNIIPHKDDIFLNCDQSLINTEKILPRIISFLSDAFSWGSCQFSYPKERKAASRIVIRKELGIVQSFTIETSFGGIITGPRSGVLYDELIWKELGSKCGEGVYHFLTKSTSPLASYVEREIIMITPTSVFGDSSIALIDADDDNDENGFADSNANDNDQNNEAPELNDNNNNNNNDNANINNNDNDDNNNNDNNIEIVDQSKKHKENLFSYFESDPNGNSNEPGVVISTNGAKTSRKSKKKSPKKKKLATTNNNNNSMEVKTQNTSSFVNSNIINIDEFSKLLSKIVVNSANNNSNSNNNSNAVKINLNFGFLNSNTNTNANSNTIKNENAQKTDVTKSIKSKNFGNADEPPSPDIIINPALPIPAFQPENQTAPSTPKKENEQQKVKTARKSGSKKRSLSLPESKSHQKSPQIQTIKTTKSNQDKEKCNSSNEQQKSNENQQKEFKMKGSNPLTEKQKSAENHPKESKKQNKKSESNSPPEQQTKESQQKEFKMKNSNSLTDKQKPTENHSKESKKQSKKSESNSPPEQQTKESQQKEISSLNEPQKFNENQSKETKKQNKNKESNSSSEETTAQNQIQEDKKQKISKENDISHSKTGKTKNQTKTPQQKSETKKDDVRDKKCSNQDEIEIDYARQRRTGRFGPTALFKMEKPKETLFVNSEMISSQSPGYSVPKWLQIQFSKR